MGMGGVHGFDWCFGVDSHRLMCLEACTMMYCFLGSSIQNNLPLPYVAPARYSVVVTGRWIQLAHVGGQASSCPEFSSH